MKTEKTTAILSVRDAEEAKKQALKQLEEFYKELKNEIENNPGVSIIVVMGMSDMQQGCNGGFSAGPIDFLPLALAQSLQTLEAIQDSYEKAVNNIMKNTVN